MNQFPPYTPPGQYAPPAPAYGQQAPYQPPAPQYAPQYAPQGAPPGPQYAPASTYSPPGAPQGNPFTGFGNAGVAGQRHPRLKAGDYLVEIDSFSAYSGPQGAGLVLEFTVLESRGETAVGSKCAWARPAQSRFRADAWKEEVNGLFVGIAGLPVGDASQILSMIDTIVSRSISAENPLRGERVRVSGVAKAPKLDPQTGQPKEAFVNLSFYGGNGLARLQAIGMGRPVPPPSAPAPSPVAPPQYASPAPAPAYAPPPQAPPQGGPRPGDRLVDQTGQPIAWVYGPDMRPIQG